jgi:hypothetical protein
MKMSMASPNGKDKRVLNTDLSVAFACIITKDYGKKKTFTPTTLLRIMDNEH